MAWYKTGSITVTNGSTSVTGTGTRFASNTRVGDGLRGPDGRWYEIVNIASETTLGISPAYQGTTATSTDYTIAPIQGYVKESADRLRAITDGIESIDADVEAASASAAEALASQNAAKTSETNAKTSETNAKASETAANTSKNAAATSATAASTSQTAAATSATNAATSATNAAASTTKAQQWATNAVDTAVETGKYSALHWATKAAESATQAGNTIGARLNSIAQAVMAVNDILIADSTTTMAKLSTGTAGRGLLGAATYADARTLLEVSRPLATAGSTTDFNTLTSHGWQPLLYSASSANAPTAAAGGNVVYWYVHVNNYQNSSTVLQVAYPYGTGPNAKGRIAWRNLYAGVWTDWSYMATTGDLGTAASSDVTTSNLDTTANRLLKVGDFGIGNIGAMAPPNNNLNDISVTATYQISSATTNIPTGAVSGSICLHLSWSTTAAHQIVIVYSTASPRSYWRSKVSGTWGAWVEYATKADLGTAAAATITTNQQDLTDGRLLKVGDYGLGTAIQYAGGSNLNTLLVPGTYAFTSGSALVNSPIPAVAQFITVIGRSAYPYQEVRPIYGTGVWYRSAKVANPTTAAADWNAWQKYVVPGDYGLGSSSVQETGDLNNLQYSGFYASTAATLNVPIGQGTSNGQGHVIHNQHLNPGYASQTWTQLFTGVTYNRFKYGGVWASWTLSLNAGDYGVGLTGGTTNLIPAGTDLNDMKTGGLYGQNANANATLALNYPVIVAGTLLVITAASSIVTQVYTIYNTGRSYTRGYYAGTWSAWLETINSTNSGVNNTGISEQPAATAQPWTGNRFARWSNTAVDGPGGYTVGIDMGYASNRRMQIGINTGGVFSYRYSDTPSDSTGWKTVTNEQSFTATGLALRSATDAAAARTTLGLTDMATTIPARLPFINLMPDSGRFGGRINPLQYNLGTTFTSSPFLIAYNGGTWAEAGKYIYNNTNSGGTSGTMTEPVTSLLTAQGRIGAANTRYGVEYFVASYTCGTGTLTGSSYNGVTRYLTTTNNSRALFQSDMASTFACWIRIKSGTVHSTMGFYLNGTYKDPGYVLDSAAGWVHIRIIAQSNTGYNNAYPNLYATPSAVFEMALPSFFGGGVDTGLHILPQATINELNA